MSAQRKILVIDDDKEICNYVEDVLSFRFDVKTTNDADVGLKIVQSERPDLILLDLKLQNKSGLDICKILRESPDTRDIPVLIFSGSIDGDNMTAAFEQGADDFIVKTVRPKELVARVVSKIRRIEERSPKSEKLVCGNLELDLAKLEAVLDGKTLPLSLLEFNLLKFFVSNRDRVMSRQSILEGVWEDAVVSNRTIDTHMVYLRKKLAGFSHVLATVYGAGYILRENPAPRWQKSTQKDAEATPISYSAAESSADKV